jgi:acetoin utilization protein AcuB
MRSVPGGGAAVGNTERPAVRCVGLRRFLNETRGSSIGEHAVFLALIVGTVFLGAELVGLAAKNSFEVAGSGAGGNAAWHAPRGSSDGGAPAEDPPGVTSKLAESRHVYWRLLAGLGVVLAAGVGAYVVFLRRRGRSTAEAKPATEQAPLVVEPDVLFRKRQSIYRILAGQMRALFESRILARHLMTPNLITVTPATRAEQIAELMDANVVRHVLVCEPDGRLVGIISDRDLKRVQSGNAAQMMTPNPITVAPDSSIGPAVTQLINRCISCLPVVEDGQVRGVLTTTDLLMALQCTLQMLHRIASTIAPAPGIGSTEGGAVQAHSTDGAAAAGIDEAAAPTARA